MTDIALTPPTDFASKGIPTAVVASIEKRMNELRIPFSASGVVTTLTDERCPGPDAPAWYIFAKKQVYLNPIAIFGDRLTLGLMDRLLTGDMEDHKDWQTLRAFMLHEHAHSAWSTWKSTLLDGQEIDMRALSVANIFDEIRIEQRVVNRLHEGNSLRPTFRWVLEKIMSNELPTNPLGLSTLWALLFGRSVCGIAAADEVAPIDTIVRASIGDERVSIMKEILDEAVDFSGNETRTTAHLMRLAQEWIDLFPEEPEDAPMVLVGVCSDAEHAHGEGADASPGDGDDGKPEDGPGGHGKGPESDPEAGDLLKKAIKRMAAQAMKPLDPNTDVPLTQPEAMRPVLAKQGLFSEKRPTAQQVAHAAALSRTFERLSLPSIQRVSVPSMIPPGRLRGREMVRKGAENALGMMSTATPWERTRRTRTTTKPIVVGTMTDTSGSMGWAEGFVAEFAYVTASAGVRVNARTAAVTFGDYVTAITKTGEMPKTLRVVAANGGSEAFDKAAATLDLMLHLTAPTNYAKLLFIVSDGHLVNDREPEKAVKWLKRMRSAGTTVVWIGCDTPGRYPADVHMNTRDQDFDKLYRDMEREIVRVASRT